MDSKVTSISFIRLYYSSVELGEILWSQHHQKGFYLFDRFLRWKAKTDIPVLSEILTENLRLKTFLAATNQILYRRYDNNDNILYILRNPNVFFYFKTSNLEYTFRIYVLH